MKKGFDNSPGIRKFQGYLKNEYIPSTVSLNYTYTDGRLSNVLRGGWLPGESGADNKQDQNNGDASSRLKKQVLNLVNKMCRVCSIRSFSFIIRATFYWCSLGRWVGKRIPKGMIIPWCNPGAVEPIHGGFRDVFMLAFCFFHTFPLLPQVSIHTKQEAGKDSGAERKSFLTGNGLPVKARKGEKTR